MRVFDKMGYCLINF